MTRSKIHSWETFQDASDGDAPFKIILAEGLRKFPEPRAALKRVIYKMIGMGPGKPSWVKGFSCSLEDIFQRGDQGFDAAYKAFSDELDSILAEQQKKGSRGKNQTAPGVVIIAHEIAVWIVKRYITSLYVRDSENFARIRGLVFIGADKPDPSGDSKFSYSEYTRRWTPLPDGDDQPGKVANGFDSKGMISPIDRLKKMLQWIDSSFKGAANNMESTSQRSIKQYTWALQAPSALDGIRVLASKRGKQPGWHRVITGISTPPPTDLTEALGEEPDIQLIPSILKVARTYGSTMGDAEVSKLAGQKYFAIPRATPILAPEEGKDPVLMSRGPSDSILDIKQPRPAKLPLAELRKTRLESVRIDSPPASPPIFMYGEFNLENDWITSNERARSYFERCELHNAEVLYDKCAMYGEQTTYALTDVVLRSQMQREVIRIYRGQFREAIRGLTRLRDECHRRMEELQKKSNSRLKAQDNTEPLEQTHLPPSQTNDKEAISQQSIVRAYDRDLYDNFVILCHELTYQLAVALTRDGKFNDARQELNHQLVDLRTLWHGLLTNTEAITQDDLLSVHVAIGSYRLLGLVNGYRGQTQEGMRLLNEAQRGLKKFKECIQRQNKPLKSADNKSDPTASLVAKISSKSTTGPASVMLYATKLPIYLTRAKLLMLQGLYEQGLDYIQRKVKKIERHLGPSHLLSLETRFLESMLLMQTSRLSDAKALCLSTMSTLRKHIGEDHPLIFDVEHVLVSIYRLQAKPQEALSMSQSLCTRAARMLGDDNQQTMRYKFQMGSLRLWIGDYQMGYVELRDVYDKAEELWGSSHPWALLGLAQRGFAEYLMGQISQSESTLIQALKGQLQIQQLLAGEPVETEQNCSRKALPNSELIKGAISILSRIQHDGLLEVVKQDSSTDSTNQGNDPQRVFVHPDIAHTLQLWAKVEITKPSGDRGLVIQTQQTVLEYFKNSTSPNDSHTDTLHAALDLAHTLHEDSTDMESVKGLYTFIINSASKDVDEQHPVILSAKQGLCLAGLSSETKSVEALADDLLTILEEQSLRLGSLHPDTLQSRLITYPVVSSVNPKLGADIASKLLASLRDRTIYEQRFTESVRHRERLALIYFMLGSSSAALKLFAELVEDLERRKNIDSEQQEMLSRINNEMNTVQRKAAKEVGIHHNHGERFMKARRTTEAVNEFREALELSIALRDEKSEITEKLKLQYAEALWLHAEKAQKERPRGESAGDDYDISSSDPMIDEERREALAIVQQLAAEKSDDDDSGMRPRFLYAKWSKYLHTNKSDEQTISEKEQPVHDTPGKSTPVEPAPGGAVQESRNLDHLQTKVDEGGNSSSIIPAREMSPTKEALRSRTWGQRRVSSPVKSPALRRFSSSDAGDR